MANRTKALIVAIKNFPTWFAQQDGSGHVNRRLNASDFAAPIELNLNGRSIRSIEANSMGEYLIVGGSYADVEDTGIGYQLYRWSGNAADTNPQLLGDLANPVPQIVGAQPGPYEAIADVPLPINGSLLQLISDNGRSFWYQNALPESKALPGGYQRFAVERVTPPNPGTSLGSGLGGGASSCAIADDGTVYVVQDSGQSANLIALNGNGLTTKWIYPLNSLAPYNAWSHSPVIGSDGTIYAGTKDYIHAVYPNGTTRWTFNIGGRRVRSNLAIGTDGTIYVCANMQDPSGPGDLVRAYAILPNGTQRWAYDMGGGTAETIALGEGVLYAANEDGGGIYAIDASLGTLIWQVHPLSSGEPETVTVAADGTIYVTGEDNNVTALNPNGTTKWVYNTPNSVDGDIALGNDGMIFAAINGGGVHAIRPNGTLAWSASVLTSCNSGVTLGPDGTLYAATCAGELVALNARDGSTKWSATTGAVSYRSRPVLSANGILFIHNNGATVSHYANAGWSPEAYQTAMSAYARSGWPTRRQNPFGTGRQVVAPAPGSEAIWKETKTFSAVPTLNQSLDEAEGYHFTPYNDGEIHALGGYFSGTKTVKLFNRTTGVVLATARVTDNYNWSYTPITPVPVTAGAAYTVAVYLEGSGGSIVTDALLPRNSKFARIDGATSISTAGSSDARPVNSLTNGVMKGQADVKFRTSGRSIWAPFVAYWDTTNYLGSSWQYAMGYHFQPSTDGWVTALGGMFVGYQPVKLFEKQSGKLLAVTFVTSSNSFNFTPIQPVQLKAGTSYTVAAYLGGSPGTRAYLGWTNSLPRFVPTQLGSNQWVYIQGSTYAWTGPTTNTTVRPTNVDTNYMYGQADIKFVPKN